MGKVCLLILLAMVGCYDAANILYVVPFTSKSHYIMLRPIGLELARRGHNVTVITANKEKDPPKGYKEVMVHNKEIWELTGGGRPNVFTMADLSAEQFHDIILWRSGTEVALNSSDVQKFLKKDNSFDLVISEQFYQEAVYALSYKYKAPLALVTTFGNCMRHNIVTGNPLQLSTIKSEFIYIKDLKSFWGRLRNFYFTVYEFMWWKYWYMKKHENLVKKYIPDLPQPMPSLIEIQKNASLILINSHFSVDPPAAYLPNVVEIGGIHLTRSDSKLPEDFQKILNNSVNGVIYMNFGSNVRSSELPEEKKIAFLNVFRKLNQTVLWKWEDENLHNQPANVITRMWMPQKEILAHPNVRVFIAHGGLIGIQEAIFNGVPVVGIPIYGDQHNNLLLMEQAGVGRTLPYHSINELTVQTALLEVLYNESFRNKAKEIQSRYKDRPMSPLDEAMFWIEYVIRYKGADFMKSPSREMNWFTHNMLDVYGFITVLSILIIYVIFKVLKYVISFISNDNINAKKNKRKVM